MLLEMAFVGAPQVNLWIDRQTASFFKGSLRCRVSLGNPENT